ncbi:myb family transcription factor [Metarhizium album ARSEF 1941]|uniref:Myb family transcription factor n=1 Tax=Metarhizium album (strain ARSEF 1941) TaxID=1081103 RepID=A0A0B2WHG3_METAS|nr:myb family transcription factor [Metarhizium album ARSEF 1941]KHN95461.1 myb family transcription factor [Metarhizium album ARSEF 1941]
MATSPMYAQQTQRLQVPPSYYTIPHGPDSASLQMSTAQQESYDAYTAEASALPPTQHRASSGAWSTADDSKLVQARAQGLNWGQIKDGYFPTKSANACRKRHERLMERKGADDWDTRKFQQLAKEYMAMRKDIWSGLAARTGEKWNVVESKVRPTTRKHTACPSRRRTHPRQPRIAETPALTTPSSLPPPPPKNLQAAARQASRRERLETGSHMTGYDDDSGISGIGLTPVDELDASYSSPETGSSMGAATRSFSSSSAPGYQLRGHAAAHPHLRPVGGPGPGPGPGDQTSYGLGAYTASYAVPPHGYSSSVSSSASMSHRYASRGNSPYLDTQRLAHAAEMGIDSLINRSAAR